MDQPFIHRHTIHKRFQYRSRRSDRRHHIDMSKSTVVTDVYRSHPAAYLHCTVIHDDHRQRTARRQARFPVKRHLFQLTLQPGIERGGDFSALLIASTLREKSGANCGICRGNNQTGSSLASFTTCAGHTAAFPCGPALYCVPPARVPASDPGVNDWEPAAALANSAASA